MKKITFEASAFDDLNLWLKRDRSTYNKVVSLIKSTLREPFTGQGKPEPLKYELSGYWSRRIDSEHRLVYKVTDDEIIIVSCRYHY